MMTTVRKYEPRDEQQLRIVAIQSYAEQLQEVRSIDPEDYMVTTRHCPRQFRRPFHLPSYIFSPVVLDPDF